MKVCPNVYAVTGLEHPIGVNAGIIETDNCMIIIDSSLTCSSAKTIMGYAKAIAPKKPISVLINTETHSDHIFGNNIFKKAGAKIYSPKLSKMHLEKKGTKYLEDMMKILKKPKVYFGAVKIVAPDVTIDGNTTLFFGGLKIKLIWTPGHTATNLCILLPKYKVLFTGDTVYSGYKPTTKFGNPLLWKKWVKAINSISHLNIKYLIPGHGPILIGSQIKKELKRNKKFILDALNNKSNYNRQP